MRHTAVAALGSTQMRSTAEILVLGLRGERQGRAGSARLGRSVGEPEQWRLRRDELPALTLSRLLAVLDERGQEQWRTEPLQAATETPA